MKDVILKIVEKEKFKSGYGAKNRPGRKVKDGEEV